MCLYSGKFGGLKNKNDVANVTFLDTSLPLSGPHSIIGRSIVIHATEDGSRWVCADINEPKPLVAFAEFDMNGVKGKITFEQARQDSPTTVMLDLQGLDSNANKFHVHVKPINRASSSGLCSSESVGGHYNPLGVDYATTTCIGCKPETCEVGDLRCVWHF